MPYITPNYYCPCVMLHVLCSYWKSFRPPTVKEFYLFRSLASNKGFQWNSVTLIQLQSTGSVISNLQMSVHKDINTNEHNSLSQAYKVLDTFVPLCRDHVVQMYKMHTHTLAFSIRSQQVGGCKLSKGKFSVMQWLKAWRSPRIILDMTVKKNLLEESNHTDHGQSQKLYQLCFPKM